MTTLSLDLAQELQSVCKEKNIEMPESYFYWWKDCQEAHKGNPPVFEISHEQPDHGWQPIAPAYTLDELLSWLVSLQKECVKKDDSNFVDYRFEICYDFKANDFVMCDYICKDIHDPNPCDACGKMLIWLIKEGLI